jgi:hypothetical protein
MPGNADIADEGITFGQVLGRRYPTMGHQDRGFCSQVVRNALAQWSEHVMAVVEGRKSKVVPLRTA